MLNKASKSDLRKLSSFLQKDAKNSHLTPAVSGGVTKNKQDTHVKAPAVRGFSHFRLASFSPVKWVSG